MILQDQIPGWFWAVIASGAVTILATFCGWIVRYVLSKNKEEWADMRNSVTATSQSVKTVSDSVNELVSTVRLHEFRITDNAGDIKDIQRHIVQYPKDRIK